MPKKIFELANELGVGALDLVEGLKAKGFAVRNHMSVLSDEDIQQYLGLLKSEEERKESTQKKKVVKKKIVSPEVLPPQVPGNAEIKSTETSSVKRKKVVRRSALNTINEEEESMAITDKTGSEPCEVSSTPAEHQVPVPEGQLSIAEAESVELPPVGQLTPVESVSETILSDVATPESNQTPAPLGPEIGSSELPATPPVETVQPVVTPPAREATTAAPASVERRPQGLRVVYRPPQPAPVAPPVAATAATLPSPKNEVASASRATPGATDTKVSGEKKKVYFEERMHSFTPVYIPPTPKKEVEVVKPRATSTVGEKRPVGPVAKAAAGTTAAGASSTSHTTAFVYDEMNFQEDEAEKERKRGIAAAAAKLKAANRARDLLQIKADEEMKIYDVGSVGKVVYSPVGRKKVYTGSTKKTLLTEIKENKRYIEVNEVCQARDLALKLNVKFEELRDRALQMNLLLAEDDYMGVQLLDHVAGLFKYRVRNVAFDERTILEQAAPQTVRSADFVSRPPIVTIMGHVDHGKTTLLDYIRKTKVAAGEAGGITQHIAAYSVNVGSQTITFIDTPGHAAFGAMRERGASLTDIVVLVVAGDDGVMPQTKESIRFCKTHNVPVVVAINKCDKEGINLNRIKQELTEQGLAPEDWGGTTQHVEISALKGQGIDELLDAILVQAEIMELVHNPKAPVEGVVLESRIEVGRGPIVTALVQNGVLNSGDFVVVGETYGRARTIMDHSGQVIKEAWAAMPVQVLGMNSTPNPGDRLNIVKNEREAKKIVEVRIEKRKERENAPKPKLSLEDFLSSKVSTEESGPKVLKLVVRADAQGSFEAIKGSLERLGNSEVSTEVIGGGVGPITDSDVRLAQSSGGYIVGFTISPTTTARRLSEDLGVDIKLYRIIYEMIDDVKMALEGLLEPETVERYIGRAEVRNVFVVPKFGQIAGSAVIDGHIERGSLVRVLRDGKIVHEGKLSSLKRFKDDVKEVKSGFECGIAVENYDKVQERDIFEVFVKEVKRRTLEESSVIL